MASNYFDSTAYGKWILCGEHSVLRGSPALVFPLLSKNMTLSYTNQHQEFTALFNGLGEESGVNMFWKILDRALELTHNSRDHLEGQLILDNQIPLGSGLGASAALCVNLAKWFVHLGWIDSEKAFDFARQLEDTSHGESSGVDIAVSMDGKPLHFERFGDTYPIDIKWEPQLYLSHSGAHSKTSDCVQQVKQWMQRLPEDGLHTDEKMKQSVALAEQALLSGPEAFEELNQAIQMANSCFASWSLSQGAVAQRMNWLTEQGAQSTKPTGSGGGGYVLGLWKTPPSIETQNKLISCFLP